MCRDCCPRVVTRTLFCMALSLVAVSVKEKDESRVGAVTKQIKVTFHESQITPRDLSVTTKPVCLTYILMSFFSAATSTTVGATGNTSATAEKDIEVAEPPTDSISSLSFSSQADYLAVGSWDNSVRFFLISPSLNGLPNYRINRFAFMRLAQMDRPKERLCTSIRDRCWTFVGTRCVSVGFLF